MVFGVTEWVFGGDGAMRERVRKDDYEVQLFDPVKR